MTQEPVDDSSPAPAVHRRGRPPQLDLDKIVTAARAMIREQGPDAVTMRALARRLGVSPMSLYHHVPHKGALFVAVLTAEAAEMDRPDLPEDDRRRLVALWMHSRNVLAEHDFALETILTGQAYGRPMMWVGEEFLATVDRLGGTADQAMQLYNGCWRLVVGDVRMMRTRKLIAAGRTPWYEQTDGFPEYPRLDAILPTMRKHADAFSVEQALTDLVTGAFPREDRPA